MHLKQIDIVLNGNGIALEQENNGCNNFIQITPEMVDLVCDELQKLKKEINNKNQE